MSFSQWHRVGRYSPLPSRVEESHLSKRELALPSGRPCEQAKSLGYMLQALIVIVAGIAGLAIGAVLFRTQNAPDEILNVVPRVSIKQSVLTFRYNQSFAALPLVGHAEPIWDSLLPNGLGYIKNTELAPNLTVISVFHQLHCLYTLRRAYYSTQAHELEDFDFGIDRAPHVSHCFEYLRQSLMCSADSTLEPAETLSKGFLGWGFLRQCQDYDALRDWAETWRAFEGHGFLAKHGHE